jgi:hypothetical protein
MFRRKNDNSGSITYNKTRLNDDFLLNNNASSVIKGLYSPNPHLEVNFTDDWSISFVVERETSLDEPVLYMNDSITGVYGISILFFGDSLFVETNSGLYDLGVDIKIGHKYTITLDFDSTSKEILASINGSKRTNTLINSLLRSNLGGIYLFYTNLGNDQSLKGSLRDIYFVDRKQTEQENTYYYINQIPSNTLKDNITQHLPLNAVAGKLQGKTYVKGDYINGWTSGVLFQQGLALDQNGYIECTFTGGKQFTIFGFTTTTAPVGSWNFPIVSYGIYGDTTQNLGNYQKALSGLSPLPMVYARGHKDIIKVERVNAATTPTINLYINAVLVDSFACTNAPLLPVMVCFRKGASAVTNVKLNGVEITILDDESEIEHLYASPDVINNYRSDLEPKHATFVNYTEDELGLNVGTSTFTAYSDYYTGVLGANFTGGGDSITYKGKELRKYGLKFNGIDQYLSVPFTLAKDKGYTIEIAFTMPTNVAFASTQPILSKRDGATNYIEVLGDSTKKTLSLKYIDTGVEVGVGNVNTTQDISKMQYSVMRVSPFQNVYLKESIATYEKVYANNQIQCVQWNSVTGATEGINPFDSITVGFDDVTGNLNIGYDGTNYFEGTLFAVRIWEGLLDVNENQINRNNNILNNVDDVTYSSKSNLKLDIDFNNPFDNLGLKLNDTSPTAAVLDAFGWANLAAIEAAREEIISKF